MTEEYITDGVPEYILTLFPKNFVGICVDVGAYDPFWISNSWIFEQAGWDVYCIEPNPSCIPRLKKYRKNVLEYACSYENKDDVELFVYSVNYAGPNLLNKETWNGEASGTGLIDHSLIHQKNIADSHNNLLSRIVKVKARTLDWLMENEIKQDHIDYLSIDVERNEIAVLKGIDLLKWNPKVISIENLSRDLSLDVEWDDIWKDPKEQEIILTEHGYRYVHRITPNDIYIQQNYYQQMFGNK
jgi:FkbM family methyltransferase